jgi:hypothetical protein
LSKKHFIAIAAAIRLNIHQAVEREAIARALLPALREANPNFNTQRFLDAAIG